MKAKTFNGKLQTANKSELIKFRIEPSRKIMWKQLCEQRQVSITRLIIDSVENRLLDNERRQVLEFIDKQGNRFAKLENNINQFAKIANSQKTVSDQHLRSFNLMLQEIARLKAEERDILVKILSMLSL